MVRGTVVSRRRLRPEVAPEAPHCAVQRFITPASTRYSSCVLFVRSHAFGSHRPPKVQVAWSWRYLGGVLRTQGALGGSQELSVGLPAYAALLVSQSAVIYGEASHLRTHDEMAHLTCSCRGKRRSRTQAVYELAAAITCFFCSSHAVAPSVWWPGPPETPRLPRNPLGPAGSHMSRVTRRYGLTGRETATVRISTWTLQEKEVGALSWPYGW